MKNMLTVLRYTILRNWRDSSSITEQILLPLGLIFVLGSALGGAFEGRDVGPTPVAYVIEATTPEAESVRDFLTRDDVGRYLEATEAGLDEARRMLEEQDVYTVIHVPPVFGDDTLDLTLIERTGNSLRTGIVRAVVRNYVQAANVTVALANVAGAAGFGYEPMPAEFDAVEISRVGRAPGAFDFYAVSMLVLTVMFVAGYAVDAMREDLLDPTGRRVRTTAISPWAHVSGKLGANTVTGLIQAAVIVVATLVVFGANWGTRPLLLAGLVVSMVVFAVAFGALVLAILRDGQKAQSAVSLVVLASMIVSGGAVQFGSVGPIFRTIQQMLPHYQGQTAMLAMIYGGGAGAVPAALLYFLGGAAVALTLTVMLARRSV